MTSDELCFTPATALVPLIRRRKVSPLELIKAVLARIEKVNPSLNAYCTVAADRIRARLCAGAIDESRYAGKLEVDGLPSIAVRPRSRGQRSRPERADTEP